MAGVLPARIRVHTAVPLLYEEDRSADWVEGEPGDAPEATHGVPFACVLFMPGPGGAEQAPFRSRVVRAPTLLYNPTRDVTRAASGSAPALVADGSLIVVRAEAELLVTAAEFAPWTGGETVRWQADGDPQPFGPPGSVYGLQATLRMVED